MIYVLLVLAYLAIGYGLIYRMNTEDARIGAEESSVQLQTVTVFIWPLLVCVAIGSAIGGWVNKQV